MSGTPEALLPITEQVLSWVANKRAPRNDPAYHDPDCTPDDLRRIELCALAVRESVFLLDLYGKEAGATPSDLQDERRPPGRLPGAEGEG